MRNVHDHATRRKRWNRAFSTVSVKEYEPIVIKRALQLVDELQRRSTKEQPNAQNYVDLAQWLSFFTYVSSALYRQDLIWYYRTDFMGDMA